MKTTLTIPLLCLLCFYFAGCANFPQSNIPSPATQPPINWSEQKTKLAAFDYWDIRGAVAVRTKEGAQSANFTWLQQDRAFSIELLGPLGAAIAKIHGVPGSVVVQTAKERRYYRGKNAEQLLYERTGWKIPIHDLVYWIRALPAPTTPAQVRHFSNQTVSQIQQAGWRIHYISYINKRGLRLPTRMVLLRNQFKVSVAINKW